MKHLKSLTAASLTLSALALVSSCRDYDVVTEQELNEMTVNKLKVEEFNNAFVEKFGEPDPNHTWGTNKELKPIFEAGTRATDGNVNVNRNQWCDINRTTGSGQDLVVEYKDDALINKFEIPGWPNVDGYFYTSNGAGALQHIYNLTEVVANRPQPVGDVTDYEIQYVSTWFRTHRNPEKTPLHLTDFFIQNVSCDNDQLQYTGFVDGYVNSLPIAPGPNGANAVHANDVLQPGTQNTKRTDYGYTPVPNVEKLNSPYNSNEELNYRLDYLHFGDAKANKPEGHIELDNHWTHVNNFNRGNSNYNPEESNDTEFREIKFITSSGTEDFACRPSMDVNGDWINDWVLVRLDWKETMADGKVHDRYGYYLGFDFSCQSGQTKISPDGFYSNWIIKITPAYFAPGDHAARVMCEDLGGSFDFDFNDVVFDIAYDANTNENIIALQAAGGTLPIYVGLKDEYEAHGMLGHDVKTPTNVVEDGAKHEIAIYRIPAVTGSGSTHNYYNVPIWVKQDGVTYNINETNIPEKNDYEWDDTNKEYNQTADKTPRKFVTEVGVKWPQEMKGIDVAYDRFHDWVASETFSYEANGKTLYWYNSIGKKEFIYDYNNKKVVSYNGISSLNIPDWLSIDVVTIPNKFTCEEYATEIVTIADYVGSNSIIDDLIKKDNDKQQITFAYILKALNDVVPSGVMIPVWVENGIAYNYTDGVKTEINATLLGQAIYTPSTWQPTFCQNKNSQGTGNPKTGVDVAGYKTYISKYSFNVKSLYYMNGANKVWCNYMMFFCKQKLNANGSTNYQSGFTDDPNDASKRPLFSNPAKSVGDVIWYETYCIL